MDLNNLSSPLLKTGAYSESLPEVTLLAAFVENNPWHQQQSVFDHTVRVLEEVEEQLTSSAIDQKLLSVISRYSKKTLLLLGTILHDVAKSRIWIVDEEGITRSPGHELFGAHMAKIIACRLGLDKTEAEYVATIVRNHGLVSEVVNLMMFDQSRFLEWRSLFRETVGAMELELVVFIKADVKGSDLQKLMPDDFSRRIGVIDAWLEAILAD